MYHGTNFLSPVVTRIVICIISQTPQILNPSFFNSRNSTRSMFSIRPNKQFHGIQFSETCCHIKVMNNRLFCSLNYQNMANSVNLVTNLNQLGQWAQVGYQGNDRFIVLYVIKICNHMDVSNYCIYICNMYLQDLLMVTYLANLTRTQLALNEKLNIAL